MKIIVIQKKIHRNGNVVRVKGKVLYQLCLLELGHSSPDNSDDAGKLVSRHARVVGAALRLFIFNVKMP